MRTSRLGYVDGLRALAVIAVVFDHAALHSRALGFSLNHPDIRPADASGWLAYALGQGRHGVELFFVLSGFCLAYPTLMALRNAGSATFDVVDFFAKRFVRILPPYYAAIATFCIGLLILAHAGTPVPGGMADIGLWNMIREALFLDLGTPRLNGSFWTLAVEFRWYFLFPAFLVLWARAPRLFLVAGAAAIFGDAFTMAASLDLWALPAFMLGIVAADLEIRCDPVRRYAAPALVVCTILGVVCELGIGSSHLTAVSNVFGFRFIAFLLVVAAGSTPRLRGLLRAPAFTFIGVASYSIYLIHEPAGAFVQHALEPLVGDVRAYGISVLAAIGAGVVFWRIAEWPFVEARIKSVLVARLRVPLTAAARMCGLPMRVRINPVAAAPPSSLTKSVEAAA